MSSDNKADIHDTLREHSLVYLFSRAFPAAVTFIGVILFVRIAGKAEYGKYSLLFSLILFVLTFSSGWISQIILRFGRSPETDRSRAIYARSIWIAGLASFCLGAGTLVAAVLQVPETTWVNAALCVLIYGAAFLYTIKTTLLQVNYKPGEIAFNEVVRALASILLPWGIFLWTGSISSLAILAGAAAAYGAVATIGIRSVLVVLSPKILLRTNLNIFPEFGKYVKYGIPLGLWLGVAFLMNTADRFLIARYADYYEVGTYSAIYDLIFKSYTLISGPIQTAAQPLIMNNWENNRVQSIATLSRSIRYQLILFPIMMLVSLLVFPLLAQYLKVETSVVFKVGIPLACAAFIWQFSMLLHMPLAVRKDTIRMLLYVSLSAGVNIALNLVFIPTYGYVAAAYSAVGGAVVYLILVGTRYSKIIRSYA